MQGSLGATGSVRARVIRAPKAPLSWRIRNALSYGFLWFWIMHKVGAWFSKFSGLVVILPVLRAKLIKADGRVIDYGIVCRRLVTQNGVGFIVDDWVDDTTDITDMSFHASGTGTTAAANDDTALETEATTVTDRVDSTPSEGAYNILQSIGTQSFTGSAAITEHGLFSVITESTGVMWDHHVFAAINVDNGDSIQWTYQATLAPET